MVYILYHNLLYDITHNDDVLLGFPGGCHNKSFIPTMDKKVLLIRVPVSSGYGAGGGGKAALYTMLQSCSVLSVVNIDAGFVAGAYAARIANMLAKARRKE